MLQGYGGPIPIDDDVPRPKGGIDPTLDACCQREIESNQKHSALMTTLRRHDRIALAERRRKNVLNLSFGNGCRCCYDPNQDGGEYEALIRLRQEREEMAMREKKQDIVAWDNNYDDDDENENEDATFTVVESHRDSVAAYDLGTNHRPRSHGDNDNHDDDDDDDDDNDDDEFDYLLDEDLSSTSLALQSFQQQRMKELKLNALMQESAMQHGFGAHRQFHPQRVLQAAGLGVGRGGGTSVVVSTAVAVAAVIHLYDAQSRLCASLDLFLEELGKTYRGTKFVRANGKSTLSMNESLVREVLPRLSMDSDLPALIAVKDGMVVAVCPRLSGLGDSSMDTHYSNIEPHAVEQWLDRAGVLLRDVPLEFEDYCRIRPEEDALLEAMMQDKAKLHEKTKKELLFDCGVPGCQKVFRHEHVGIRNMEQCGLVVKKDIALGQNSK